jgi:hypothetical protein
MDSAVEEIKLVQYRARFCELGYESSGSVQGGKLLRYLTGSSLERSSEMRFTESPRGAVDWVLVVISAFQRRGPVKFRIILHWSPSCGRSDLKLLSVGHKTLTSTELLGNVRLLALNQQATTFCRSQSHGG